MRDLSEYLDRCEKPLKDTRYPSYNAPGCEVPRIVRKKLLELLFQDESFSEIFDQQDPLHLIRKIAAMSRDVFAYGLAPLLRNLHKSNSRLAANKRVIEIQYDDPQLNFTPEGLIIVNCEQVASLLRDVLPPLFDSPVLFQTFVAQSQEVEQQRRLFLLENIRHIFTVLSHEEDSACFQHSPSFLAHMKASLPSIEKIESNEVPYFSHRLFLFVQSPHFIFPLSEVVEPELNRMTCIYFSAGANGRTSTLNYSFHIGVKNLIDEWQTSYSVHMQYPTEAWNEDLFSQHLESAQISAFSFQERKASSVQDIPDQGLLQHLTTAAQPLIDTCARSDFPHHVLVQARSGSSVDLGGF